MKLLKATILSLLLLATSELFAQSESENKELLARFWQLTSIKEGSSRAILPEGMKNYFMLLKKNNDLIIYSEDEGDPGRWTYNHQKSELTFESEGEKQIMKISRLNDKELAVQRQEDGVTVTLNFKYQPTLFIQFPSTFEELKGNLGLSMTDVDKLLRSASYTLSETKKNNNLQIYIYEVEDLYNLRITSYNGRIVGVVTDLEESSYEKIKKQLNKLGFKSFLRKGDTSDTEVFSNGSYEVVFYGIQEIQTDKLLVKINDLSVLSPTKP